MTHPRSADCAQHIGVPAISSGGWVLVPWTEYQRPDGHAVRRGVYMPPDAARCALDLLDAGFRLISEKIGGEALLTIEGPADEHGDPTSADIVLVGSALEVNTKAAALVLQTHKRVSP